MSFVVKVNDEGIRLLRKKGILSDLSFQCGVHGGTITGPPEKLKMAIDLIKQAKIDYSIFLLAG